MGIKNIYTYEGYRVNTLWEALGLFMREHMVISFTGGGGKTSAMFSLADELAGQGKHVIVTTSTHIYSPENRRVLLADRAEAVKIYLKDHGAWPSSGSGRVLVTGSPAPEGKLKGMALSEMEKLADFTDVLLVEADGAKRLPLKIPGEGEPVLLKGTHAVIGCAGLDAIGQPWEEKCFRWELADQVFGRQTEKTLITPEQAAQILSSGQGTRKGAESMEYRILLNKADDESRMADAAKVIKALEPEWKRRCVITSFLTMQKRIIYGRNDER